MMKCFMCILFIWMQLGKVNAETTDSMRPLSIGDKMPDIAFKTLLQYPESSCRISSFRGKWLILDCWSILCGACIQAMPHLYEYQQRFKDKMVIFPVAFGSDSTIVQRFMEKRKSLGREIKLPTAIYPSVRKNDLYRLFPVLEFGFPVEILIDTAGVLVAITDSENITAANLEKLLHGEQVYFPRRYFQQEFDREKLFLVAGNGGPDTAFMYRSMITPSFDSVLAGNNSLLQQKNERFLRLFSPNSNIAALCQMACYERGSADPYNKHLAIQAKYPWRYTNKGRPKTISSNRLSYCYELVLPKSYSYSEAFAMMREDVCRYFQISLHWQLYKTRCLVISRQNGRMIPLTKKGTPVFEEEQTIDSNYLQLRNGSFKNLLYFLNLPGYPVVVDETHFKGNIDVLMALPRKYDFSAIKQSLGRYGLRVQKQTRLQRILVIREIKTGKSENTFPGD